MTAIMYVLLMGTIVLGLGTTVLGNLTGEPDAVASARKIRVLRMSRT